MCNFNLAISNRLILIILENIYKILNTLFLYLYVHFICKFNLLAPELYI
jgi:hypothetical protein